MTQDDDSAKRHRLVDIAERLLRESGGAAFSMKAFAARANISLKTAYNLFGSKQGVMLEIFRADGERYRQERDSLFGSGHFEKLEDVFAVLRGAVDHFLRHTEFYEYIFSVEDAVKNDGLPPAREVVTGLKQFLRVAIERGTVLPQVDPDMMAEHFTDVFSSAVSAWAKGRVPSSHLYQRIAYGYATNLAAIATEDARPRMLQLAFALQDDPDAMPPVGRSRPAQRKRREAAALDPGPVGTA